MMQMHQQPPVALATEYQRETRVHFHEQRFRTVGSLTRPQRAEHDAGVLADGARLVVLVEDLEGDVLSFFLIALESREERLEVDIELVLSCADEREVLRIHGVHDELNAFVRRLDDVRVPKLARQIDRFLQQHLIHRPPHNALAFRRLFKQNLNDRSIHQGAVLKDDGDPERARSLPQLTARGARGAGRGARGAGRGARGAKIIAQPPRRRRPG